MQTRIASTRPFRLDAAALALAHASPCLALDTRSLGATMALATTTPAKRIARSGTAGSVAVLEIYGPLQQRAAEHMCGMADGYDAIAARFADLMIDPAVDAVVLRIDSPGGDAAGVLEAARRMSEARRKPVYAYADELAASAAYALATVADSGIYLPASGHVGSVGVIALHVDESQALANDGLKVSVFRSGARKAEGLAFEPLSKAAAKTMQDQVDEHARQFAALVGKARGMSASAVLALEGAVFMGEAAVRAGLADGVASWETVLARASSNHVPRPTATRASVPHAVAAAGPPPRFSAAAISAASPSMKAHMARANAQDAAVGQRLAELSGRPGSAALAEAAELAADGNAYASRQAQMRAQRERLEAAASTSAPLVPPGRRYEELGGDVLHNLRATDAALYGALRDDWIHRGRPSRRTTVRP